MNLWQLGLASGTFPFRSLVEPGFTAGDELDLMTVDDVTIVSRRGTEEPQRLTPANRHAELRIQHRGVTDWVRVAAVDGLTAWLEFLPLTSTFTPDRGWAFTVHDYVLDDLERHHGVPTERATAWLARKFIDSTSEPDRVMVLAGPLAPNPDAFSLLGDGFVLDVKRTPHGAVAHRISRNRKVIGELHGASTEVKFISGRDHEGENGAADRGLFATQTTSPLQEAYQRWLDVEIAQLARATAGLPLVPVEDSGDARQTLHLVVDHRSRDTAHVPDGARQSDVRVQVGRRDKLEHALQRVRAAAAEAGATDDLLTQLQTLRESGDPYRVKTTGDLEPLGNYQRRGPLVALELDVGSLQQFERQHKALRRSTSSTTDVPILTLATGVSSRRPVPRPIRLSESLLHEAFRGAPTDSQLHALRVALNTPDVAVVQGPPGTGKTRLLTALRLHLAAEQHARGGSPILLLTGPQHDAVDNLAVAGMTERRLPAARLGSKRSDNDGQARDPYGDQATRAWARALADRLAPTAKTSPLSDVLHRLRHIESAVLVGGTRRLEMHRKELLALARDHSDAATYRALAGSMPSRAKIQKHGSLIRLVRRLRCNEIAFRDDGAYVIRQLLGERDLSEFVVNTAERRLLTELSVDGFDPSDAQLDSLAALKADILARSAFDDGLGLPRDFLPALASVRRSLEAKARDSVFAVGDAVAEFRESLDNNPSAVRDAVRHYSDAYALTCGYAGAKDVNAEFAQPGFAVVDESSHVGVETVIVDEAARENPLNVLIAAQRATKRVVLVGDQLQLPPLLEQESLDLLEAADRERVSTPLFKVLFDRLDALRREDGIERVATLTEQFRMHPRIGDFVSRIFYEPEGVQLRTMRPASDFPRRVEPFRMAVAAWRDVPAKAGAAEGGGKRSWWRGAEVDEVARVVKQMREDNNSGLSIGVICFYSAQARRVQEGLSWPDPSVNDDSLWVGTVDGSQGREFDVVVISTVRSAPRSTHASRASNFGHLVNANRLNVAFSRARRLLVVVGDRAYLTGKGGLHQLTAFGEFADEESARG